MSVLQTTVNLTVLSELKNTQVAADTLILLLGKSVVGDGQGGFFYWDPNSTATEDLTTMNVIASTTSATGRWLRSFQRTRILPQGVLGLNGTIKTLYAQGVTDANGRVTVNSTMDNSPTGTPIFTEIWSNGAYAQATSNTPSGAIQSYLISQSMTQSTYGFYKANALTITLGLAYAPFASIGAGQAVNVRIEGV